MSDFATRLRELRMGRGLRQKDLALALGLAQTTIANYEQKLRFPDEPTLVKIADFFSVTLDELMGRGDGSAADVPPTGRTGGAGEGVAGAPPAPAPLSAPAREFIHLLREKGPEAARSRLRELLEAGTPTSAMYIGILTPALREVGRLWAIGEMSVADEHYFSEATQQIMASLLPHPPAQPIPTLRCVVLPVSGEQHLIGARMVGDLLTLSGAEVRFLGAHLSIGHMRETLLASPPDLVALSVTMPAFVNTAADTIRALREKRALSRTRVMVGGQAFEGQPTLWKRIGADGLAADAADAVSTALRLVAGRD